MPHRIRECLTVPLDALERCGGAKALELIGEV